MDISPKIRRLVMIGACYVDTILSVPKFPQEDHKLRATTLERRRGGNVANTLEVLQQFRSLDEIELVLLCVLPAKSSEGTKLVKDSFGERVDTDHCIYRESHHEPASSYIIKADDCGSRTIVNFNELPEMEFGEFKEKIAKLDDKRTWFHFEGREVDTSIQCLKWLKQEYPDCTRSVEVEKPNRPGLDKMAEEADIVFFSKTWAEAAGYSDAGALLKEQAKLLGNASLLCCTWGAKGATVLTTADGSLHSAQSSPEPESKVVDTIGAGDTFTAGILGSILAPDAAGPIQDRAKVAVDFANRLAGRKVLQVGFSNLISD
ncbi:pfkB family kinase [Lecanosticta acicola]|uniref:PfkB family kinase n=1 Tax=Lecanosticta acicola TaxID=111012 RepID=A0AAI8VUL4_9PEZI|nr:pfkB family kinase [Lecanosticta acicola]